MAKLKKIKVISGVYWVEVEEANVFVLCGCPADAVKHLKKRGLIEEITVNGEVCETGPNAILLSEVLIQNSNFSNLTEFPVLQMLYLQGMLVPNHPKNTGIKPMLIGTDEQLRSQMEYIYRGNYGLINEQEMMEAGIDPASAEMMMKIKLRFAFGRISAPDQLIDTRVVSSRPVLIRNEVYITRQGFNRYEFSYKDEKISVDLNLEAHEQYAAPYQLSYHHIRRDYFSVIHSGEGDGWDLNRPCMASILVFQGKIYLVDAGPNVITSLNYLGISVNEIEGIFHTHAHDDHFAGLATLIRTDRRFKYYSTPLVRMAVSKKLCALMSLPESQFNNLFDICDLELDCWNNVEGLEVMPCYSPHPVETNIFFFRAAWQGSHKVYAHLADVVSMKVLNRMLPGGSELAAITEHDYDRIYNTYLTPAHLKKVDVGGGRIHGDAEDFRLDSSGKLVFAHTSQPLTQLQREIGSSASFGMVDVLIPSQYNYLYDRAREHLCFYFPNVPEHELAFMLNHEIITHNAGSVLLRKGEERKYVYLLLTGSIEFIHSDTYRPGIFPAGSLIGFYAGYQGSRSPETYWASSHADILQLPVREYSAFINRNGFHNELKRMEKHIMFLESTWLFGEVVSFPILARLSRALKIVSCDSKIGIDIRSNAEAQQHVYMVSGGKALLHHGKGAMEYLEVGDFFGAESLIFGQSSPYSSQTELVEFEAGATYCTIPAEMMISIPIIHWRMLETYEKRFRRSYLF